MVYGVGNSMCRSAYMRTVIGKNYTLPVSWMWVGKERDITRIDIPKRQKMRCIAKYPHHALFENTNGIRMSMTYYDLAVEYSKNRSLV